MSAAVRNVTNNYITPCLDRLEDLLRRKISVTHAIGLILTINQKNPPLGPINDEYQPLSLYNKAVTVIQDLPKVGDQVTKILESIHHQLSDSSLEPETRAHLLSEEVLLKSYWGMLHSDHHNPNGFVPSLTALLQLLQKPVPEDLTTLEKVIVPMLPSIDLTSLDVPLQAITNKGINSFLIYVRETIQMAQRDQMAAIAIKVYTQVIKSGLSSSNQQEEAQSYILTANRVFKDKSPEKREQEFTNHLRDLQSSIGALRPYPSKENLLLQLQKMERSLAIVHECYDTVFESNEGSLKEPDIYQFEKVVLNPDIYKLSVQHPKSWGSTLAEAAEWLLTQMTLATALDETTTAMQDLSLDSPISLDLILEVLSYLQLKNHSDWQLFAEVQLNSMSAVSNALDSGRLSKHPTEFVTPCIKTLIRYWEFETSKLLPDLSKQELVIRTYTNRLFTALGCQKITSLNIYATLKIALGHGMKKLQHSEITELGKLRLLQTLHFLLTLSKL